MHGGQGVQPHGGVAPGARLGDDGEREPLAQPLLAVPGADIQPPHFTDAGRERAQPGAAPGPMVPGGDEQAASGRSVVGGKCVHLPGEVLEVQVDAERGGIFEDEGPGLLHLPRMGGGDDLELACAVPHETELTTESPDLAGGRSGELHAVARAGRGDADLGALQLVAAAERVPGDEQGGVQVRVVKAAQASGEVGREAHGEHALHHAANHQLQAGGARQVPHRQGLHHAALHRLDVDAVRGALAHQAQHILGGAGGLVGADGDARGAGERGQALEVLGGDGLLEEGQRHLGALQAGEEGARLGLGVAAIGVGEEAGLGGHLANGHEPLHVLLGRGGANLHLQGGDAPREDGAGGGDGVGPVPGRHRHVDVERGAGPAEEDPQGHAVVAGQGIEQRRLEGTAGGGLPGECLGERLGQGAPGARILSEQALAHGLEGGEGAGLGFAADGGEGGGLAQAGGAIGEGEAHQGVVGHVLRPGGDGEGLGEGQVQRLDGQRGDERGVHGARRSSPRREGLLAPPRQLARQRLLQTAQDGVHVEGLALRLPVEQRVGHGHALGEGAQLGDGPLQGGQQRRLLWHALLEQGQAQLQGLERGVGGIPQHEQQPRQPLQGLRLGADLEQALLGEQRARAEDEQPARHPAPDEGDPRLPGHGQACVQSQAVPEQGGFQGEGAHERAAQRHARGGHQANAHHEEPVAGERHPHEPRGGHGRFGHREEAQVGQHHGHEDAHAQRAAGLAPPGHEQPQEPQGLEHVQDAQRGQQLRAGKRLLVDEEVRALAEERQPGGEERPPPGPGFLLVCRPGRKVPRRRWGHRVPSPGPSRPWRPRAWSSPARSPDRAPDRGRDGSAHGPSGRRRAR
ncbi:hypothetical protein STIAU_3149 [Stigmatella aurantiaca DW4/3-1]|uniref:Uncharacterized protein n=1 Tax=Stigmatella aurantiaca (strain DW4/3-1) TaxID=378806 RepID=Q08S38_STIAD|nr:hypothetical protein STIAU_3149 [Stigmatella aurantiaca DW4/3-1]